MGPGVEMGVETVSFDFLLAEFVALLGVNLRDLRKRAEDGGEGSSGGGV